MSRQWNSVIASQTDHFRGTSSVSVRTEVTEFPNVKALSGAAYHATVSGGVSGSFGILVAGILGNDTRFLCGVTDITAAGDYVLYPVGYSSDGSTFVLPLAPDLITVNRLDQIVPPIRVDFQSGDATEGISASCTVNAVLKMD